MSWRYGFSGYGFRPYVSVAQRRANAAREVAKMAKKGQTACPVHINGRTIATTFWGKAWCANLESYSDYSNRLPRGRTYVRNGSVVDLQITAGKISALVSGSALYKVKIDIETLRPTAWKNVKERCAGQIGSLIELLQGKLSQSVMEVVTAHNEGLFPKPAEIKFNCSCPDWAGMCKHVAAVLYGIGARLDHKPELLFHLRQVDHLELIEQAADVQALDSETTASKTIAADELADVFGIELEPARSVQEEKPPKRKIRPASSNRGARGVPAKFKKAVLPEVGTANTKVVGKPKKSFKSAKASSNKTLSAKTTRPPKKG